MFAPNTISLGAAFKKSASADRAPKIMASVSTLVGKRPVSVGVVVEQVVAHRIDDRGWNLGPAGSVEVGDWILPVETTQSRKMVPDGGNGSHR